MCFFKTYEKLVHICGLAANSNGVTFAGSDAIMLRRIILNL